MNMRKKKIITKNEIILKQVNELKEELDELENNRCVANLISKTLEKDGLLCNIY